MELRHLSKQEKHSSDPTESRLTTHSSTDYSEQLPLLIKQNQAKFEQALTTSDKGQYCYLMLCVSLVLLCNSSSQVFQNLLSFQQSSHISLKCIQKDSSFDCDPSIACNSNKIRQYVPSNKGLINWRVTFSAACVSDKEMELLDICFFIGFIIGCPLFTRLADKLGKKIIVVSGLSILCSLNVLIFYIPYFNFLYFYQFILGLQTPMTTVITYMWLSQLVPQTLRGLILTLNAGLPGLYFIIVSLIFKTLQDWRMVYLILNIVNFFLFATMWFGMPDPTDFSSTLEIDSISREEEQISSVKEEQQFSVQAQHSLSATKKQPLRKWPIEIIIIIVWYLANFLGSGMAFTSYHFHGDIFINSMMIGLADTLSSLLGGFLSSKIGSKAALIFCSLIGVSGSITYITLSSNSSYVPLTLLAISFGGQAADALLYSISAQEIPQYRQGRFFSLAGTFSRVGTLSATIVASYVNNFMVIYLGLSLGQFLFAMLLKHPMKKNYKDSAKK